MIMIMIMMVPIVFVQLWFKGVKLPAPAGWGLLSQVHVLLNPAQALARSLFQNCCPLWWPCIWDHLGRMVQQWFLHVDPIHSNRRRFRSLQPGGNGYNGWRPRKSQGRLDAQIKSMAAILALSQLDTAGKSGKSRVLSLLLTHVNGFPGLAQDRSTRKNRLLWFRLTQEAMCCNREWSWGSNIQWVSMVSRLWDRGS